MKKFVSASNEPESVVSLAEGETGVWLRVDGVDVAMLKNDDERLVVDGSNLQMKGISYEFVPPPSQAG